jgi:uncharacterized protein (TIGR03437 family)
VAQIVIGNQPVTIRQPPVVVAITPEGVVNGASFRPGAIAAGEIFTVFGVGFGSPTRVLFDDVAAPVLYAGEGQLSAIVPYAAAGKTTTRLRLEYLGVASNTLSVRVAPAAPAIFSADSSGTGPGAILNQDFTLNTAQTPADRGSIVQIFATGEGQTLPAGVDNKVAAPPLPAPILPVAVTVAGRQATVTYAGAAPGLVAGVFQINARVPQDVTPGPSVPVTIRVGEFPGPDGITLSVR